MKKILVLSAQPWEFERDSITQLSSRMGEYEFLHISPASVKGPFREYRFKRRLKRAVSRAEMILVSPAAYAGSLPPLGKPVRPLPDGVDFDRFSVPADLPVPAALAAIGAPVIGMNGAIDGDSNLIYIEKAAEAHPEWHFVFTGPVLTDLSGWDGYANIHLLSGVTDPPAWVNHFDVCINITKNEDSSPVGLYEYLASGKPIVSTPHPAQVLDYTEAVYLAGTPEEFIACCKKAIGERDAWKTRRRVEYGRAASWEARTAELEKILRELSNE
jgi:glycosyltransferase involved in cell wall biosynthesis